MTRCDDLLHAEPEALQRDATGFASAAGLGAEVSGLLSGSSYEAPKDLLAAYGAGGLLQN